MLELVSEMPGFLGMDYAATEGGELLVARFESHETLEVGATSRSTARRRRPAATGSSRTTGSRSASRSAPTSSARLRRLSSGEERPRDEAPEQRAHLPPVADPRAHPRLPARGRVGAAREREARTTSCGSCRDSPRAIPRSGPPAPSAHCSRSGGRRASCSAGTPRPPASGPGCRRSATGCRPTCSRRRRPGVPCASLRLAVPAGRRVGRGDREPDRPRSHARRPRRGRDGRPPRSAGGAREAERIARNRLHGRDQAVSPPDRVPRDDAADRARVAGARRRADAGARVAAPAAGPPARASGRPCSMRLRRTYLSRTPSPRCSPPRCCPPGPLLSR